MNNTAMEETKKITTRYTWVDNIKFACCILVVLGHTFMGFGESGIIEKGVAYNLLIQTVYSFHVPLFFVCSGFLYQKSNRVHSIKSWSKNIADKLLSLGVPYFVFTTVTILSKIIFSDSVNNQAGSLLKTLFLSPTAPYWYLYALFFMFVFIPCLNNKKQVTALFFATFAGQICYLICQNNSISLPYIINSTLGRSIWFVIGMFLAFDIFDLKTAYSKAIMIVFGFTAIGLSFYSYRELVLNKTYHNTIGLLFVISIIILSQNLQFDFINRISFRFSEYFMPVYVMHTIFSAGVRIVLLKLGIVNIAVHIISGLLTGFIIPIIIYQIMRKIPLMLFSVYPKKALKTMEKKSITKKSDTLNLQQKHKDI